MTVARALLAIELAYCGDAAMARAASTMTMTERDVAMASIDEVEPPEIREQEFVACLDRLLTHLRGFKKMAAKQAAE